MELGLYTFADVSPSGAGGERWAARYRDLLEEIELADQVGLDVFGVGEHHRELCWILGDEVDQAAL
jgi:hypothetical protein